MLAVPAHAADTAVGSADGLRAKYADSRSQLGNNQFQRPLYLQSSESPDGVAGEIYALIDQPFAMAAGALNTPGDWCEVLILHLNTKYCRASTDGRGSVLNVSIGSKYDQPLEQAYRVVFAFRIAAQTPDYLQVRLNAEQGPLSTRDYRIVFEAVPLDGGRTFIRLSYAYAFGMAGRMAMQVYLGTAGRNKVGFTIAGAQADGQPLHIGGTRGVVERNTMRYYLAIDSYLGAVGLAPAAQLEHRLQSWFTAVERYPRQLHEMDRATYLEMKRAEHLRQQTVH